MMRHLKWKGSECGSGTLWKEGEIHHYNPKSQYDSDTAAASGGSNANLVPEKEIFPEIRLQVHPRPYL